MLCRSLAAGLLTLCALADSLLAGEDTRENNPADHRTPANWVSLPTDSQTKLVVPPADPAEFPSDVARWLRPQLSIVAEWEPQTDGVEIVNYDVDVLVPTYPFYGPPPPFLNAGFSYTDLMAPAELDIPPALYDFTLGASWMRPIHERWTVRVMVGAAFATDMNNTGADAWQLRGGLFAIYDCQPDLQLLVGVVASGRDDLPVLPGLGVIWKPTPSWHLNLMMPRPRVSYLLADQGERQHWIFIGGGLSGGTWAFESQGIADRITYREFRVGLGWESGPPKTLPPLPGGGLKFEAEVGFVFGRTFEFETRAAEIELSNAFLLRTGFWF
jgi:hypothetical protein